MKYKTGASITVKIARKIAATRNPSKDTVETVVKKYAEENPQKLRQIGIQYDLSHAKGGVSDEDAAIERKKEEAKEKLALARKKRREEDRKSMQDAAKHMEEAAKSLNKAAHTDTEAKKDGTKDAAKDGTKDGTKDAAKDATKDGAKDGAKDGDKKDGDKAAEKTAPPAKVEQLPTPEPERKGYGSSAHSTGKEATQPSTLTSPTAPSHTSQWGAEEEEVGEVPETAPEGSVYAGTVVEGEAPPAEEGEGVGEGEGEEASNEKDDEDDADDDADDGEDGPAPWNAVCVMGLRVYTLDPEATITLVKPDTVEEAAALIVDSAPAGATM